MTATLIGTVLVSCTPKTYSDTEIKAACEEERLDASGVRGAVSIGANSHSGPSMGVSLSVNDKFLRGVDPQAAYDQCVQKYNDRNLKVTASQAK